MPTRIAIGFSFAEDLQEAAYQASASAKTQLGASADLVMLFTTPAYAGAEILDVIHSILKPARLVGTTAPGLILTTGIFPKGLVVLAVSSTDISFGTGTVAIPQDSNAHTMGFDLGQQLNSDFRSQQRQACLLFADPVFQNHAAFFRGAQEVIGRGFPLAGAVAGGNGRARDCQFHQKKMLTQNVVGFLIGGANIGMGHAHGFKPLGKPRTVTKSHGNVICTIDDQPAFSIYEHFLGPEAEKLKKSFSLHGALYPLGLYMQEQGQYLLKNAVDILPDGSIVCQGEAPEGAEVHVMIGSREACHKSAVNAATQAKEALGGKQAKLVFIIESAARHRILKNSSSMEIQAVRDVLGQGTPLVGIYAHGAIAPLGSSRGISTVHVQNGNILILGID